MSEKGVVYVNIYRDEFGLSSHAVHSFAPDPEAIACVRAEWFEGQFDSEFPPTIPPLAPDLQAQRESFARHNVATGDERLD